MQQSFDFEELNNLSVEVGSLDIICEMPSVQPKALFDDDTIEFLNFLSGIIMKAKETRQYPDLVSLGFWLRKANILSIKDEYGRKEKNIVTLGRGVVFHIAPSNVPVNFAYSLFLGLLCGNANIVKIPSKQFAQVDFINRAIIEGLDKFPNMKKYISLVRYGHEKGVTDVLSSIADARIIWGGDNTIEEIRKSPIKSRAVEVTFADRFSVAVVDAKAYLLVEDKSRTANDFYNDTYLTDQNACTSPKTVVWYGDSNDIESAKKLFWDELYKNVSNRYDIQPVQVVNKLTEMYLAASNLDGVKIEKTTDNIITRVSVDSLTNELMDFRGNSGYFYEYDCKNLKELFALCNDTHCQTISYIGNPCMFDGLLELRPKGIDRIVPIGKTMDFEFIWDGYQLVQQLSRSVRIR